MQHLCICNLQKPTLYKIPDLCNKVITFPSLLFHCLSPPESYILCTYSLCCSIFNRRGGKTTLMFQTNKVCMLGTCSLPVPLSFVVLFFVPAKALEKRRGVGWGGRGARNPIASDSWDLVHVLNLDTNVGSFYGPSVVCFMCLPNTGREFASLSPSLSISYITMEAGCQRALGPLQLSPARSKSQSSKRQQRSRNRNPQIYSLLATIGAKGNNNVISFKTGPTCQSFCWP